MANAGGAFPMFMSTLRARSDPDAEGRGGHSTSAADRSPERQRPSVDKLWSDRSGVRQRLSDVVGAGASVGRWSPAQAEVQRTTLRGCAGIR